MPVENHDEDSHSGDTVPQPFVRQEAANRHFITRPIGSTQANQTSGIGNNLRFGCAALCFAIGLVLIGFGIFLPPIALGEQLLNSGYMALNSQSPNALLDNLTVAVDPSAPGSDFAIRLKAIPVNGFKSGTNQDDMLWVNTARGVLPSTLTLLSPVYQIESKGTAPTSISISVTLPQGTDPSKVDLYQYSNQRWQFLPAHPSGDNTILTASVNVVPQAVAVFQTVRLAPVINTTIDAGQAVESGLLQVSNVVHPAGLRPTATGVLVGSLPGGIEFGKGYAVVPLIRNFSDPAVIDVATIQGLLQDKNLCAAHVAKLVELVSSQPYQGIAIDYRQMPPDQRENFSVFIKLLADRLHQAKLTLTVVVPFPTQAGASFDTGAYDWQVIGAAADTVQVILPLDPQAFAQNGLIDSGLAWVVGEISRTRLQIGLISLSVQAVENSFAAVGYPDALAPLGKVVVRPDGIVGADAPIEARLSGYLPQFVPLDSSGTPAIRYFNENGTLIITMWLTTTEVMRKRLDLTTAYNLAGALILDLASTGAPSGAIDVISAFKVNQPANAQPETLALHWTVMVESTVFYKATAVPGTPFFYRSGTSNMQIGAALSGAAGTLEPAWVEVSAPAATPTPAGSS